ncbi:MAG: dephospho-CoA kinase [Planctomycetota bacterium]
MGRTQPIIGICGGIGAGKSLVATEFERLGCLVVSSDRLNHEVLRRPEVLAKLRNWWGDEVIAADGSPDRQRIAELIFADADKKRRLEDLVYPLIAQLRQDMINAVSEDQAVKAIILDSPLLFESNLDRLCDTILFVEIPREQRLRRLQQSRSWTEDQLRQRERWLIPLADKRSRCDFVINNEGTPDQLRPQVVDILKKVTSRHADRR